MYTLFVLETGTTGTTRRTDGVLTKSELEQISTLLKAGACLKKILVALGQPGRPMPSATFYFRLKKSKKRIHRPQWGELVDLEEDNGDS